MRAVRLGLILLLSIIVVAPAGADPLPGSKPLEGEDDLAVEMVAGIDRYLTRVTAASVNQRKEAWKLDFSTLDNYNRSVQPNRDRLKKAIGAVDPRLPVKELEYVGGSSTPSLVAETNQYWVYAVRWPVFEGVWGEGLLLEPKQKVAASIIALGDADWTPEMLVGLVPGLPKEAQFARRLAENGCRVVVPVLIDRKDDFSGNPKLGRMTNQPHREFIYRMSFEMGRHIIGYEVQKVLAVVDWFAQSTKPPPIGIVGYGEGGLLAIHSAALDTRIKSTMVSGYFNAREKVWQEPIYRNVWGQLREFGDAELAGLVAGRHLIIERSKGPELNGPPGVRQGRSGAAPGRLISPPSTSVLDEFKRAFTIRDKFWVEKHELILSQGKSETPGAAFRLIDFFDPLAPVRLREDDQPPPTDNRKNFDPTLRQKRQFEQLVQFTQRLLHDSEARRHEFFWSKLDMTSVENYQKSTEPLRTYLREEVIGMLPPATEPLQAHTRESYDQPKWKGYEVVLDVYPEVFAYGILLVPKDLKAGEKRPVVVCQHGLEGRPQDVVNPKEKTRAYNSYGAELANRGYIVYAPQNPYIGRDNFRVLQRKANPLKLSLFSFIVRQHERTLDWLETLPYVDKNRIAFYGLSYGGKTAMRVPALEKRYCLSICSGDFNEWIAKNVSVDFRGSYMFTGEYEMFEFDLGHTFNYAEMAALIAPRPFMVERGHDDGVGIDEMVAYEYAKVRRLYSRLKLPERTEIEFFAGGHVIHGQATYAFLQRHLQWPK